jgi:signal transduction histidine kinase
VVLRARPGVIEVQDEGPGFTEEDKDHAFERFRRLSAKPTAGERSTGLGLSIVKALVEAMGGEIELVSEAGRGATFRIHLGRV